MTQAGRQATVALVAAAAIMVAGRASAHDEPTAATGGQDATIVMHVVNYAALSRDVLDVAMARVATVYERMGVRIVWVEDTGSVRHRQDRQLHLTVLLLSRDMAEKKIAAERIKDGVFGQAHVSSGRAAIFCDRIATAPGAPTYFPTPLGDVIAHEVGHLVLGANGRFHHRHHARVRERAIDSTPEFRQDAGPHHPQDTDGPDGRRHREANPLSPDAPRSGRRRAHSEGQVMVVYESNIRSRSQIFPATVSPFSAPGSFVLDRHMAVDGRRSYTPHARRFLERLSRPAVGTGFQQQSFSTNKEA